MQDERERDRQITALRARVAELEAERAERQRLEQQAEERRLYLESVLACVPDAIITMDAQHRVMEWNPGAEDLFGYTPGEAIGRDLDELIAAPDAGMYKEAIGFTRQILSGEMVPATETVRYGKDGRPVDVVLAGSPILVENDLVGIVAVYTDITQRKKAEEELRRLSELHESIVQNMAEGIAVQDAEGYFTLVNPAAATLLGYQPEELVGQYWTLVVPPDQQHIVREADERRLGGEANRYEVELLRKDGTHLRVLVSGSPRIAPGTGAFDGTLAVFTDISDRVQAEETLARRAREMAALYETALGINAQRDLPTLLNAIVERASMLVGARMGGLYLFRPESQELELVVGHNLPGDFVGTRLQLGEGLSGRIARTGEPLMVSDYSSWAGKADAFAGSPFRRILGVPLKVGDRVIGVINVTDEKRTGPFGEDEIRLVSLFADQAAIAVENTRLFEAEARRRREAETLHMATQALSATLDLQEVFELILSHLRQVVPYDSATVQQRHGDRLRIIGGHGFPNLDELLGVEFDLKAKDNPNREVVSTRTPLILDDAPTLYEEFNREPHAQAGIRSWLGVPLLFGDQLTGMIALDKREPGFYRDEHARLALAFAAQAAIAIENARLFEAEREQRDLAEALRAATAAVSSTLDLDQILDRILEQMNRVISNDAANIMLIEDEHTRIVRWCGYERFGAENFVRSVAFRVADIPGLRRMQETGAPVIIPDTLGDENWVPTPEQAWIRSYAGAPIHVRGEVIGFLNVDSATPGFFTPVHAERLRAFADEASLAIENARLFKETSHQAEQMATLNRIGLAITSGLDLAKVLEALYEQVKRVMDAGAFYVALYDEKTGRIHFPLLTGVSGPHPIEPLDIHTNPGVTGYIIQSGQPLYLPDLRAIPEDAPYEVIRLVTTHTQAYIGVPLIVRERVVGVLSVQSYEPNMYTQADVELLMTIAAQASAAIENARLYEAEQRQARDAVAVSAIAQALNATSDLPSVFETVAAELHRVVDFDRLSLALLHEEQKHFTMFALTDQKDAPLQPGVTLPLAATAAAESILAGRPHFTPDLAAELDFVGEQALYKAGLRSRLNLPLWLGQNVIGALNLASRRPDAFSADQLPVLTQVAAAVAAAVQNAQLFQAEREQRELAEALRQATVAVSSTLELDHVFDEILKQVGRVLPDDSANIMLIEDEQVRAVRWRGYDEPSAEAHLRSVAFPIADTPNLRQMQERGKAVVIPDTTIYPGWIHGTTQVRSYAGAPIRVRDQVIGFLNINKRTAGFFTQAHADRLQVFADQAGLAIGNARFFQNMEQAKRDWETTFDAMQDAVALVDRQHDIVRANRAFTDLTQRPFAEVVEQNYHTVLADQVCTETPCPLEQAMTSGQAATCVHAYGGRVFEVQTTPVSETNSGETDSAARAIYVLRDITERERAAREIRRRNRELTLLNRIIAASVASRDIESILETVCRELAFAFDVSQSAAALFNEERTKAVVMAEYRAEGRPSALGEIIPVEGNPAMQRLLRHKAPLAVGDARTDPSLAPVHDLMWRRGTASLLILPLIVEGEVVGSLGVDATEPYLFSAEEVDLAQRVAEQVSSALARARLEETQRHLSAAVEQAAESIVITDIDGTIIYVNPAFERISGYSRDETVGQNARILKSDRHDQAFYRELWQTVASGQVWQGRFINKKKDGSLYTEDSTITPVRDQSGEIVNYVAVNHDVTRMVQLEEQFRQSQKMEALGQLAGGIAHDFNNLLTIIQLSTRLLQQHLHPEDPLWEHVQRIQDTGERAGALTKQLLSFSRREIVEPRLLNLAEVVGDLSRMLKRIIGEDVELVTKLGDGLWPVRVDPTQVDQIILNLVVNARDAMPQGGSLIIETDNVTLDEAYAARHVDVQAGQYVLLSITDTGMGIADEVQPHIFEPFFTTKERGQGTGLGLAAVFGIVKQNEGHIRFDSKVGLGTTFKVYLPRAVARAAESLSRLIPPVASSLVRGTETILVVEDEPAVLDLAVRVLKACGYHVLTAGGGPEAIEIGREHDGPIDLLVTDVVMPQMYGKDVADQLQSQRPEMRLLFMSGYPDRAAVQQRIVRPGVAFLSKPFTVEELTLKVRAVLDDRV